MAVKRKKMTEKMIAVCGMNCAVCMAHLRERKPCPGCRSGGVGKPNHCYICYMKVCEERGGKYCFSCSRYPCLKLKKLDERYRRKYNMSEIENLESIRKAGIKKFLEQQEKKWTCGKCGVLLSCHRGYCLACGQKIISSQFPIFNESL